MTIIGFSGHRDCIVDESELDLIRLKYPRARWIHGGCKDGFDYQVSEYITCHKLESEIYRPQYNKYHFKEAPLQRNKIIVINANIMVFCYDGRKSGGTYQTKKFAEHCNKTIELLKPIKIKDTQCNLHLQ